MLSPVSLEEPTGLPGAATGTFHWPPERASASNIDVGICDNGEAMLPPSQINLDGFGVLEPEELLKAALAPGSWEQIGVLINASHHLHAVVSERLSVDAYGVCVYVFDSVRARWYVRGRHGGFLSAQPVTPDLAALSSADASALARELERVLGRSSERPYRADRDLAYAAHICGYPPAARELNFQLSYFARKARAEHAASEREARVRASLAATPPRLLLTVR